MVTLIERGFTVNVSLERAWQKLARLDQWPRWAHHIKRIEVQPPGELGPQTSGVIYLANGMKATFRMTEFNPGHSWKWVGPFLWLTVHYDHCFESLSSHQTRVTFVLEASGFGAGFFGRLFAWVYRRDLEKAIPLLVKTIESEGQTDL